MTHTSIAPLRTPALASAPVRRRAATRPDSRYCGASTGSRQLAARRSGITPSAVVASGRTSSTGAVHTRTSAPMRLTRRGRVLLTGLAVVVLLVVFSLGRATSQASSSHKSAARPTVVVQAGETLWQLAQRVAPAADPRVTVERIMRLNDVHRADQVRPGQQIVLPG